MTYSVKQKTGKSLLKHADYFWLKPSCFIIYLRPLKWDGNELSHISVHCRLASANGILIEYYEALAKIFTAVDFKGSSPESKGRHIMDVPPFFYCI